MIFFKPSDFDCKCCGLNKMDDLVYKKLEFVRWKLEFPLYVNSGFRCEKHNLACGGKIDSFHLIGKAVDVSLVNLPSEKRSELFKLAKEEFNGIGIARMFIHMDIRDIKTSWVY